MILGISSFTYGWAVGVSGHPPAQPLGPLALLHRAAELGVRCVQFGDNLPLHELPPAGLAELRTFAQERGLRIEVGARGLTAAHLDRYLDLCGFFGADLLRFIIDGPGYEPAAAEVVALLRAHVPALRARGVRLGIENHDRFKAQALAQIVEQVGSEQVGICLDCVNSLGADEGLEHVAQTLAPYTINLHVKDYQIERFDHKMGFTVTGRPAGQGMLDLPFLLAQLAPHQRCHSAILELWTPPEATLAQTVAKEETWARRSVEYLLAKFPDWR
jgi:3-oxoisoapionate decarboxylase